MRSGLGVSVWKLEGDFKGWEALGCKVIRSDGHKRVAFHPNVSGNSGGYSSRRASESVRTTLMSRRTVWGISEQSRNSWAEWSFGFVSRSSAERRVNGIFNAIFGFGSLLTWKSAFSVCHLQVTICAIIRMHQDASGCAQCSIEYAPADARVALSSRMLLNFKRPAESLDTLARAYWGIHYRRSIICLLCDHTEGTSLWSRLQFTYCNSLTVASRRSRHSSVTSRYSLSAKS